MYKTTCSLERKKNSRGFRFAYCRNAAAKYNKLSIIMFLTAYMRTILFNVTSKPLIAIKTVLFSSF